MQGRARGRKGERKTYHIWQKKMCAMEFGIYLLNMAKPPRAQERQERARANRKGSYPTKKLKEFSTTPISESAVFLVVMPVAPGPSDLKVRHCQAPDRNIFLRSSSPGHRHEPVDAASTQNFRVVDSCHNLNCGWSSNFQQSTGCLEYCMILKQRVSFKTVEIVS